MTQVAVNLELQTLSLPHCRKMPSWYFEDNSQLEHHSNVEDFYYQIYIETVDTIANSIVEHFNQNITQYMQTMSRELVSKYIDQLGAFYSEFDSDTL